MDVIGVRDNRYTTAMGMIRGFINKMKIRGKNDYTMISEEEDELITSPDNKVKKDKMVVSKIFKGFIKNKEEQE